MYLVLDCETNGLPRNRNARLDSVDSWPRAVQVAWGLYDRKHRNISMESYIVRPEGFAIPRDSERVHGISTERALAEGVPIGDVLARLSASIDKADLAIAHNVRFDGSVIAAEYYRLGLSPPITPGNMVCTMEAGTDYCCIPGPYGNKWPTLDELYRFLFNKSFTGAHDASIDVA
ncbi:MAG: 3'-5' exonuclease, partial [Coriobacteriia bacterium]|nr:3'-5' exonuclease [Coriobacteriia bacterium]